MLGGTLSERNNAHAVSPAGEMRIAREEPSEVGVGYSAEPIEVVVIDGFVGASWIAFRAVLHLL